MPLFNIKNLRSELETKDFVFAKSGSENINEYAERKLNEQAKSFSPYQTYDVFLSHSIKDAVVIMRLSKILESYGLNVYVDWVIDKKLDRSKVTTETANIIRERLKSSRSFLLALTSNSAQSNWVQWELGLGDGQKNGKVEIIPLITDNESNSNFYRQEYLGLYPFIDYTDTQIWVNGKRWITLKDWIAHSNPLEKVF